MLNGSIPAAAAAAALAFFATQLDELLVLVVFFSRSASSGSSLTITDVILGNALGGALILALSATGTSLSAAGAPFVYLRWLGLLPVLLGVRTLLKRGRRWLRRRRAVVAGEAVGEAALLEGGGGSEAGGAIVGDVEAGSAEAGNAELGGAQGDTSDMRREGRSAAAAGGTAGDDAAADAASDAALGDSSIGSQAKPYLTASTFRRHLARFLRPGFLEVLTITLAAGAEEVAVYLPLLATASPACLVTTLLVLFSLIFLWQALAAAFVRCRGVAKAVEDYGEVLEPWALIAVGVWCVAGAGGA